MRPTPVSAFGVTYPSIRKAAAAFGLAESTLRRRLAVGVDVEVALLAPTYNCRILALYYRPRRHHDRFQKGGDT